MSTVATILAEKQVKFEQGVNALAVYSRDGISWANMQKLIEDLRENCVTKENFDVYGVLERKCTDIDKLIWGVAQPFPGKTGASYYAMHAYRDYLKNVPMVWGNLETNRVELIKLIKIKFPDYRETEEEIAKLAEKKEDSPVLLSDLSVKDLAEFVKNTCCSGYDDVGKVYYASISYSNEDFSIKTIKKGFFDKRTPEELVSDAQDFLVQTVLASVLITPTLSCYRKESV